MQFVKFIQFRKWNKDWLRQKVNNRISKSAIVLSLSLLVNNKRNFSSTLCQAGRASPIERINMNFQQVQRAIAEDEEVDGGGRRVFFIIIFPPHRAMKDL